MNGVEKKAKRATRSLEEKGENTGVRINNCPMDR